MNHFLGKLFLGLFFTACFLLADGQEAWDLERCINYALENNIQIKQYELNVEVAQNILTQSKADLFPSVNASGGYNINIGKTIDFTTLELVNQNHSHSLGVTSGVTLFEGVRKINTIRRNQFDLIAQKYNAEDIASNVALNVTSAYLQVLLSNEELSVARSRLQLSLEQKDQTQRLVDAGVIPEGSIYDIEAQLAADSLSLVLAMNNINLSKLNLALLLQLEDPLSFDVVKPEIDVLELTSLDDLNPDNVYSTALNNQPSIKRSNFEVRIAEKEVKLYKGLHSPTLSFNYQIGTSYSSRGGFGIEDDDVLSQYEDNLNQNIGFSLRIPVFNGLASRTAVKNAELRLIGVRYADQNVKDRLKTDIYIAFADAKAAFQSYFAARRNVSAIEKSFEYIEKRFDLGAANNLEYSTARTNLSTAENQLIQSKYDYLLKLKILDYYLGNPITLN